MDRNGMDGNGEQWKGKVMSILVDRGLLGQYPIDVSVLKKGDVIDTPTLEQITGKKADHPDWPFALLNVKSFIEKVSRNSGNPLIPRISHGTIDIQTDERAAKYTDRRATLSRRGFYRNHRRQLAVDMRNLSEPVRKDHERSIITNGRMISVMNAVRGIPEVKAHERTVPVIGQVKDSNN